VTKQGCSPGYGRGEVHKDVDVAGGEGEARNRSGSHVVTKQGSAL